MDILREDIARNRRRRRIVFVAAGGGAFLLITLGLSRLKPASPTIDGSTVWIDTVKRGHMVRQVRGPGSLVPVAEGIQQISAAADARVERIIVAPGSSVEPQTILLELANPELQRETVDAELQLEAGKAELVNTRLRLERDLLDQRAAAATVSADYHQAQLQAETNESLYKQGLLAEITLKLSRVRADELATRNEIEKKRLGVYSESARAQLAVQRARVEQLRALAELRKSQMEALHVRAGIRGVLQELPLQPGQRVAPGAALARVVQPDRLKAQLRIAESQARDVQIGQPASIDTRNGIVAGRVARIDPAAQNGTVTVDVALDGRLPRGARPDLSVDGTIELDNLPDTVFVGRPAFAQENAQITLFRLRADGDEASRVKVRLGKTSVDTVQILDGLKPGDRVILSDVSAVDRFDRVRVK
jgi:HlyD family secretion protein